MISNAGVRNLKKVWMKVEGIAIFKLGELDDSDLVALIDGRTGLIVLLNDVCFWMMSASTLRELLKLCVQSQSCAQALKMPLEIQATVAIWVWCETSKSPYEIWYEQVCSTKYRRSAQRSHTYGSTVLSQFKKWLKTLVKTIGKTWL